MNHPCSASFLDTSEGVGVGLDLAAGDLSGSDRLGSLGSQLLVLGEAEILVVKVLVDDASHAALAVVASGLRAVVPDGLLVLDSDLEDIGSLALLGGKVEARGEAIGERLAGLAEAGLDHGVVAREEVPPGSGVSCFAMKRLIDRKTYSTTSPISATTLSGSNRRPPRPATTVWVTPVCFTGVGASQ